MTRKTSAWSKSCAPSLLFSVPIRLRTSPIIHSSSFILSMYLLFSWQDCKLQGSRGYMHLAYHCVPKLSITQCLTCGKCSKIYAWWMNVWMIESECLQAERAKVQLSPLSLGPNYWHDHDILNSHFHSVQPEIVIINAIIPNNLSAYQMPGTILGAFRYYLF